MDRPRLHNGGGAIPRLIHRIWLDEPMPDPFAAFGDRWAELHPGWEIIDWRTSALLPELRNRELFDQAREFYPRDWKRFQADILRLELLGRYGGVYVDTDTEPLAPLDDLLAGRECVVGRSPQHIAGKHPITNAFMASTPQHPWIEELLARLPEAARQHSHRPLAQSIGPWHLTRVYEAGEWPTVSIIDGLYSGPWFRHLWNNAARKRGVGV